MRIRKLDTDHLGRIYISELTHEGLTKMFRRTMTDEGKIKIYERYKNDGISEEVTRLLLGEEFDILQEDTEELRATVEGHTSEYPI